VSNNASEHFRRWLEHGPPEEHELRERAIRFQKKHFADLTLKAPSVRKRILNHLTEDENGAPCVSAGDEYVSIEPWRFRFHPKMDARVLGRCNHRDRIIWITKNCLNDVALDSTILHEMIHAYESQLWRPFREWLIVDLHERLARKIEPRRLRAMIDQSTHLTNIDEETQGVHFLLKSLDLDLRFGWPLGTVFGYGRVKMFAEGGAT
jgi:hypothetical protein